MTDLSSLRLQRACAARGQAHALLLAATARQTGARALAFAEACDRDAAADGEKVAELDRQIGEAQTNESPKETTDEDPT